MAEVVIESKLLLPRMRQLTVARSRLEDLLSRGAETTLTLIAAPAGFGKTTVLGSWLAQRGGGCATAWVSLDERDTDAAVFWTHLLHAVERAVPGAGTSAIGQLESGRAPIAQVLTLLLNELGVIAADLSLVLDDYHLAESAPVQSGMSFLLEHLPPHVHLAISTRIDPALPLARLRARGELVEIRAADLRFTSDEAAAYLNDINALALDPADVAALEARTEGWPAALQLAALSLRGKDDPSEFISGFAGDHRFVVDYLAGEVLDRQSPGARAFLLATSVLDELSAPLCAAVTGRADSGAMLEHLERANLFLVPLDDQRRRYRYHHLFADVLRAHLVGETPDAVPVLHRRASDWYDQAGDPEASVRHALAAGDLDLVAERIELAIPMLQRARREAVLRRWAHTLPTGIVRGRPVLAVGFIGALMSSNDFAGVAARLRDAESLLYASPGDLIVADKAQFARLPATVETYHAALALVGGHPDLTVQHAQLALARAVENDHLSIGAASALIGLAAWTSGDLEAAHHAYRTAADHLEMAGHIADVLGCSITLADLELARGRLRQARRTYEHALELAGRSPLRGIADMYVGLSRIAWEEGDTAAAGKYLGKADAAGDSAGLPQNPYRWRVMMAHLRRAGGETRIALQLLEEAAGAYVGDFSPDVQPVAATRARILAASGDLASAQAWVRDCGIGAGEELSYLSEYNHLTLARILLAEHVASPRGNALSQATALVADVLAAAERGGRIRTVIESLALEAVCRATAGDLETAMESLSVAVELAEPEGFVGVFADVGPPMADLLAGLARRRPRHAFIQRLLEVSARWGTGPTVSALSAGATDAAHRPTSARGAADIPVEPLSGRELDVLRLLGSDLSGPDIARRLHVSLATVRTHTQHIYSKLGVNNRRAAVRRAHQLDLFRR